MNIKSLLEIELWNAIEKNYTNANYTGAINDAIFYMRDIIREKSNLENDGDALINQAFSEKNPKIKLNKLRTKHDKNIQNGMRDSLLGIWKLIRNTRNHEKHIDNNEDASSIILYINYLLKIIGKGESSFSIENFINHVYDKHFEKTEEYSKLLVDEIPTKQLEDTIFHLYGTIKNKINIIDSGYHYDNEVYLIKENYRNFQSLKLVFVEIMKRVDENSQKEIYNKISLDFKTLNESIELFWKVYLILEQWEKLGRRIQLRLTNIIVVDFDDYELKEYQNKIFIEGWEYFDDATQAKIKDLYIHDSSDYYVEEAKLKYKENRVPIKVQATPKIFEIDINEDEIPF